MLRPDLVDVWIFRRRSNAAGGVAREPFEFLLMRRSSGRILPGLWQCVSGSLESHEDVVAGALRELEEETGIHGDAIEALYHLDQVNSFFEPAFGGIVTAAVFAVRVKPAIEPMRSDEHDEHAWLSPSDALARVVWPAYRESIDRITADLSDPERARWFELRPDGTRLIG